MLMLPGWSQLPRESVVVHPRAAGTVVGSSVPSVVGYTLAPDKCLFHSPLLAVLRALTRSFLLPRSQDLSAALRILNLAADIGWD